MPTRSRNSDREVPLVHHARPKARPGRVLAPLVPLLGVVVRPFQQFFRLEASSGLVLLAAAAIAFAWANWPGHSESYSTFVELPLSIQVGHAAVHLSVKELINDGLMTLFFFVVGMEIKRELARGELRTPARAALPAIAALGGMVAPAAVFMLFAHNREGGSGWGIPMATDIAFTIGCLSLLKRRVPHGLLVFVTALAIFDDIGGILVIALFYGSGLSLSWLLAALAVAAIGYLLNRLHVRSFVAYGVAGAALWYALHHSGVHATLAGVALGLLVPARSVRPARETLGELGAQASDLAARPSDEELAAAEVGAIEHALEDLQAPLDRFVHTLHPAVAFVIVPAFAFVNAGVHLSGIGAGAMISPVALGVGLGLLVGKQAGIFTATLVAVKLHLAPMPGHTTPVKLYGASVVAGIGFTVALFIANLAYANAPTLLAEAKMGILSGSALAGVLGLLVLRLTAPLQTTPPAAAHPPVAESANSP